MALGGINVNDECPVCGPGFVVRVIDRRNDFIACEKLTPGVYRYYQHSAQDILKAHLRRAGIPAPDHVWLTQPNDDRFPHKCPTCGGAAYIGLNVVEHQGAPCR